MKKLYDKLEDLSYTLLGFILGLFAAIVYLVMGKDFDQGAADAQEEQELFDLDEDDI